MTEHSCSNWGVMVKIVTTNIIEGLKGKLMIYRTSQAEYPSDIHDPPTCDIVPTNHT